MMKLKKWVVRLVLGGLLLLFVAAGLTWLYLDRLAAGALTAGLDWAANVHSEVGWVSLAPFTGHIDIRNLTIGNPPNYKARDLLRVGRARVAMDFRTIWHGPVQVGYMEIDRPVVRLEAGPGGSNVQVFMESLGAWTGLATTPAEGPTSQKSAGSAAGPGMRICVEKLLVRDATLQVCQTGQPEKSVSIKLIELRNVSGRDGAGLTSAELSGLLISQLIRHGAAQGDINLAELFRPELSTAMEAMLLTGGSVLGPVSGQALTQPFQSVLRWANPSQK